MKKLTTLIINDFEKLVEVLNEQESSTDLVNELLLKVNQHLKGGE